jgi:hypothetical protein
MLGSAVPMTRSLRCIVPLALAVVLASCGGDSKQPDPAQRASASSDVEPLLKKTFANVSKMDSATVDLKVNVEPRSATSSEDTVSAHLSGPFASQGVDKLPRFAFAVEAQAAGQSFSAGATYDGSKAYVALMGTPYAVTDLVTKQFVAGYEQALKTRQSAQGGLVLGSLGIDFTKWLPDARNEGESQVGDAKTIKLSGTADVKQVIGDLETLSQKAASLPGASGQLPAKLTPEQKAAAEKAIKSLKVDVYTGAEDSILRRLVVTADLQDAAAKVDAGVLLDLTFTKVGQKQTITAPSNPKPFSELLKAVDKAGIADLGLGVRTPGGGTDSTVPKSSSTPNNVDKYAACIEDANGDAAKARKCADLLSG